MSSIENYELAEMSIADLVAELYECRELEAEELELCRSARLTEIPVLAVSLADQIEAYLNREDEHTGRPIPVRYLIEPGLTTSLGERAKALLERANQFERPLGHIVLGLSKKLVEVIDLPERFDTFLKDPESEGEGDFPMMVEFGLRDLRSLACEVRPHLHRPKLANSVSH